MKVAAGGLLLGEGAGEPKNSFLKYFHLQDGLNKERLEDIKSSKIVQLKAKPPVACALFASLPEL